AEFGQYHPWTGKVIGNFNSSRTGLVDIAPGGNMSVLREIFQKIGGFDIQFDGTGYFAETDACLRIKALGYKLQFDPEARIKHLQAPAGGCRVMDKSTQTYYFCKNGMRLYRRHSPLIGQPLFYARMLSYV